MPIPHKKIPVLDPDNYTGEEREEIIRLNKLIYTPLKELNKVPEAFLVRSYQLGYNYYEAGEYEKAEVMFRILTLLDHPEVKYWNSHHRSRAIHCSRII